MKTPARAIATALFLTLTVGGVTPAHAETVVQIDKKRDAKSEFDLKRAKYDNAQRTLTANFSVRNLQNVDTNLRVFASTRSARAEGARYELDASRTRGGKESVNFFYRQGDGLTRRACRGLTVAWKLQADRISVKFPQRCFGDDTGRQRIQSYLGFPDQRRPADSMPTVSVGQG